MAHSEFSPEGAVLEGGEKGVEFGERFAVTCFFTLNCSHPQSKFPL